MYINGDVNWTSLLNDAVKSYRDNIQSTINMPSGDYPRNSEKRNIFSKF